jgi:hypothetical protein
MQQPRQMYGLGSLVKKAVKGVTGAVKGVAGGIKDIVKSDAGKLALLLGGGYLAGGGGMPQFLGGKGLGGFSFSKLPGAAFLTGGNISPNLYDEVALTGNKNIFQKALSKIPGGGLGLSAASLGLGALAAGVEEGDPEAEAATRDVSALRSYLASYYENLGYNADQIAENVARDTSEYTAGQGAGMAEGGRMGLCFGR